MSVTPYIRRNRYARALLAAAFLFVLLAEWSSHSVICTDALAGDAHAMSATESGHEDPCQTLVLCSDSKQKDQQMPKLGHDAVQHNALFNRLSDLRSEAILLNHPPIPFEGSDGLFRPPSPPFHPPKLA